MAGADDYRAALPAAARRGRRAGGDLHAADPRRRRGGGGRAAGGGPRLGQAGARHVPRRAGHARAAARRARRPGQGAADPGRGSIPSYPAPEEAVRALAHVVRYARWREQPPGRVPDLGGIDVAGAREVIERELAGRDEAEFDGAALLARYGIEVWPVTEVRSPEEAVAAAERHGWPVVLKSADPEDARRTGTVRVGLVTPEAVRAAYADLSGRLGKDAHARGPAHGSAARARHRGPRDRRPGVRLGGELRARRGHRAAARRRGVPARPAHRGRTRPRWCGRCARPRCCSASTATRRWPSARWRSCSSASGCSPTEFPEVARLDLDPVLVGESGVAVLGARGVLRRRSARGPTTARAACADRAARRIRRRRAAAAARPATTGRRGERAPWYRAGWTP